MKKMQAFAAGLGMTWILVILGANCAIGAEMRPVEPAPPRTEVPVDYLASHLPEEAVAYLRIPNLWSVLYPQPDTILKPAAESATLIGALDKSRLGLIREILANVPAEARDLLAFLLERLHSPVEVAVLRSRAAGALLPDVVVTVLSDFKDANELDTLIDQVVTSVDAVSRLDGAGGEERVVYVNGFPIAIDYDDATRRLTLLAGNAAAPDAIAALHKRLEGSAPHPMRELEQAVDTSGGGVFAWIDTSTIFELGAFAIEPEKMERLRMLGLTEATSIAVGAGVKDGIQRTRIALTMPRVGIRRFIPLGVSDLPLPVSGKPRSAVVLSLPNPDDLAVIEQALAETVSAEDMESYLAFKQALAQFGVTLEEIVGSIGPELVVVNDRAGQWSAIRLRDAQRFAEMLEHARNELKWPYERREVAGLTINHLAIATPPATVDPSEPPILQRMSTLPTHVFWVESNGYLIFAGTPQTLLDRHYAGTERTLEEWLRTEQHQDPKGALLLANTSTPGLPRLLHDLQLQTTLALADLAGEPIDIFSLPSASELGLPEAGAYGLRVDSLDDRFAIELSYESNPFEIVFAGGYEALVVMGVIAAIAVPAYQDYLERSEDSFE